MMFKRIRSLSLLLYILNLKSLYEALIEVLNLAQYYVFKSLMSTKII